MRLQDGIHGYERFIAQQDGEPNMWEGHNFVFDKRQHLGITEGEWRGDAADLESERED